MFSRMVRAFKLSKSRGTKRARLNEMLAKRTDNTKAVRSLMREIELDTIRIKKLLNCTRSLTTDTQYEMLKYEMRRFERELELIVKCSLN